MSQFPSESHVILSLQHNFTFDPSFINVNAHSECELKFFCEAFSLIDSFRSRDLLGDFINTFKKTKGEINCKEIIALMKNYGLVNKLSDSDDGLDVLLESIYLVIRKIVEGRFVSCLQTSTIGCITWEVGTLYEERSCLEEDQFESNNNICVDQSNWKIKAQVWKQLAEKLRDLAKFQQKNMKIHHDFQKSNYANDPRVNSVYGFTMFLIFGMLFMLFRGFSLLEAKEFVHLLMR